MYWIFESNYFWNQFIKSRCVHCDISVAGSRWYVRFWVSSSWITWKEVKKLNRYRYSMLASDRKLQAIFERSLLGRQLKRNIPFIYFTKLTLFMWLSTYLCTHLCTLFSHSFSVRHPLVQIWLQFHTSRLLSFSVRTNYRKYANWKKNCNAKIW